MKIRLFLAAGMTATLLAGLGGAAHAAQHGNATHAALTAQPTLNVVSCTGSSFCFATGTKPGHGFAPLIEEWTGKTWRIIPNPKGYTGQITCGGPSFCLAVVPTVRGYTRLKDVLWNGRSWVRYKPKTPNPDVTCLSPTFCTALLIDYDQLPDQEVYWTGGTTWQTMPGSDVGCGGAWCDITQFSCASATNCQDSGNYCGQSDCNTGIFYYSDVWNGTTWSESDGYPGPGFGGDKACAGRSFCMILDPPKLAAVSTDWVKTWQSASANLATACHHLASCTLPTHLACGSARFCMALPSSDPTGALTWNGVKWGFVKLALVSGHLPKLTALSCGSMRNCVATGTYQISPRTTARPIAEHWNGKAWTVTPIAKP